MIQKFLCLTDKVSLTHTILKPDRPEPCSTWVLICKKKLVNTIFPLLLLTTISYGCINLRTLHEFAAKSEETLEDFNNLNLDLSDWYQERIINNCLENHDFYSNPVISDNFLSECKLDSLSSYEKADSSIDFAYFIVQEYFSGLKEISENERIDFSYNTDALDSALSDNKILKVSTEKVNAIKMLSKFLSDISADAIRRRAVRKVITEGNSNLQEGLSLLIQIDTVIIEQLKIQKAYLRQDYEDKIAKDTATTYNFRRQAAQEYVESLLDHDQKIALVSKHVLALNSIKEGHQEIFNTRNKMKSKYLAPVLARYITELEQINAAFNKTQRVR